MAVDTTTAPDAAHGAHGASTEAAGHGGGGLPQFQFEHWGGQIVWLLLIFAVLYLLLSKVFAPRLRKVIDERAETISGALAEASKVQAEADAQAAAVKAEIEQGRASARRIAAEAQARAAAELASRQAAEDERLAGQLAEAEVRIRAMRDQAMSNVQTIAADTAGAIVEKLTGKPASPAELAARGAA